MTDVKQKQLTGRCILIVEDEFFLADDLQRELTESGADVAGPVNTLERARAFADEPIDFAVLDINLKGEMIFPFADELRARGVPFVFATGYDAAIIPARFREVERWEKPFGADQLAEAIAHTDWQAGRFTASRFAVAKGGAH